MLEIVHAEPNDAAVVAAIQTAALAELPTEIKQAVGDTGGVAASERRWRLWLNRRQAVTLLARRDTEPVGFAAMHSLRLEPDTDCVVEITALYVSPPAWRTGVGRLLLERCRSEAERLGVSQLVLWVFDCSVAAKDFYRSTGFRADGAQRVFASSAAGVIRESRLCLPL